MSRPNPSSINWEELHDHLVAEFAACRERTRADIDRMRKVVDAVITCRSSREVKMEDFAVNDLVNGLKTVERYVKKEIQRASRNNEERIPENDS